MDTGPPPGSLHFDPAPDIVTDRVPGPRARQRLDRQDAVDTSAVLYPGDLPFAPETASGATVRDADGNTFLDFFAGIGVLNVGHANPYVTEAVSDQAGRLTQALDFPTEARLDLIEALDRIAPGAMAGESTAVFGGPSGSDAVEASIKLVKQYTGDDGLVAFRGSFHGETAGAFSLSADTKVKRAYTPLLADVQHVPYPYPLRDGLAPADSVQRSLDALDAVLGDRYGGLANPAGVWVEPIQGEGGVVVPPEGFLSGVRDLCDDHGVPLVVDEVQTGFGRTGDWFACEHAGVTPDAVPLAKGFGGGLPLGGLLYREALDTWGPGGHTGTFRGFVPGHLAALRAIEYVEAHDLLARSRDLGATVRERLAAVGAEVEALAEVRGRGLYVGAEFLADGDPAPDLVASIRTRCFERGVLTWGGGRDGHVLRLMPPLVITPEQVDAGMDVICDVIRTVAD
ncbi:MAG: aspartate aminotransferase family protein [Halobacteriaceae archaeon]